MRFPNYRRAATYRTVVPALCGGLDVTVPPTAVKDYQLTAAQNVFWKDGTLRTRGGLHPVAREAFSVVSLATHATALSDDTVSVGDGTGRLLMGVGRAGLAQNRIESVWIDDTGELTAYTNDVAYSFPIRRLLHVTDGKSADSLGTVLTDSSLVPLLELKKDGTVEARDPYIPTILLQVAGDDNPHAAEPAGYSFESRNMLTDGFSMECTATEHGTYFHLPSSVRGVPGVLTVTAADAAGTVTHTVIAGGLTAGSATVFTETNAARDGYRLRYDEATGTFWLVNSTDSAVASGDTPYTTLKATFVPTADDPATRAVITGMRFGIWFGGDRAGLAAGTRYFVAGNPDFPHRLYYSGLSDVTYFPENNYVTVGRPAEAITALKQQGNMLVIFKEHELFAATYASAAVTADDVLESAVIDVEAARALFPVTPLSPNVGCDCPQSIALCGNRLVWATSDGAVYTLYSADNKSERNVRELSTPIAPLLKTVGRDKLKTAQAVDADGFYMLFAGADAFLFHYDERTFYSYASYDAGDKPGKILAWHCFQLPEDFEYSYVFSVGDVLTFVGFTDGQAVCYHLDGTRDEYYPETAVSVAASAKKSRDVKGYFVTKRFSFGTTEVKKQIKRLTLYATPTLPATAVTVTYQTERGADRGGTTVRDFESPVTFVPNGKRVREFGVRVDVVGPATFDGFSVRYGAQGE